MIIINLLPPELRRRRVGNSGVSPVFISIVAGSVVNGLLLLGLLYVHFLKMPAAVKELASKNEEYNAKKVLAGQVLAREGQITSYVERRDRIVGLLARKVYWARTIDDFANLLTGAPGVQGFDGEWGLPLAGGTWMPVPGFEVRAMELSVRELGSGGGGRTAVKQETVLCDFRWRYKLVGIELVKSGDYLNSFFKTTEKSQFWLANGFLNKPEDRYFGDKPRWNDAIARVIVDGALDWQREKQVDISKKTEAAPAGAPQAR